MRTELFEMYHPPKAEAILEELRKRIATVAGVTLSGNRLTVRWNNEDNEIVHVHSVILHVEDGKEEEEEYEDK